MLWKNQAYFLLLYSSSWGQRGGGSRWGRGCTENISLHITQNSWVMRRIQFSTWPSLTIFERLWRSNYFPSPIRPAVKKRLGDSVKNKPFCKYFTFFFDWTVQLRDAFSIDLGKCWRKRVEKYSFPTKHKKNAQPSISFSFSFGIEANVFNSLTYDLATFSSAVQLYCLWVLTHAQSTQTTEDLYTGTDAFIHSFVHSFTGPFIHPMNAYWTPT